MLKIFLTAITLVGLTVLSSFSYKIHPLEVEPSVGLDKRLILKLVNKVRTDGCNCGGKKMPAAAALIWNDNLAQAALNHSKDMARNRFFNHTSSDGRKLNDRYAEVGYKWMAIAENIAYGQEDEQDVVKAWFKSPGHCRNLMNPDYQEMGAAKAGIYWTMDFGTQRNW